MHNSEGIDVNISPAKAYAYLFSFTFPIGEDTYLYSVLGAETQLSGEWGQRQANKVDVL